MVVPTWKIGASIHPKSLRSNTGSLRTFRLAGHLGSGRLPVEYSLAQNCSEFRTRINSLAFKFHVCILSVAFVAETQHYAALGEVLRVMIFFMLLDAFPAHVHQVAFSIAIYRFQQLTTSNAKTSRYVADDVSPERPGSFVPCLIRGQVYRRACYRRLG